MEAANSVATTLGALDPTDQDKQLPAATPKAEAVRNDV
jgi:hypothetical protein